MSGYSTTMSCFEAQGDERDEIMHRINESYVQSLMKMMSSKVHKELRAEHEKLQRHLTAVTQDVLHLARDLQLLRDEDRGWHQEAKWEAVREELQGSAMREKQLVGELGQLKRWAEGRYEDLAVHQRSLEKELRGSQRELLSSTSELQRESAQAMQELRQSLRETKSQLEAQQEAVVRLEDVDFNKVLGDARQVLSDLEEERSWHKEAMKALKGCHEEQKKQLQAESKDLDERVSNFHESLQSTLPKEMEKSEKKLLQHTDRLLAQVQQNRATEAEELASKLERFQQQTEGRVEECLDRARLLDQDILDKINPELLLMKDQQQRLTRSLQELFTQLPAYALGESQVQQECQIFRADISKLSEEFVRLSGSMEHVLPWVDWLQQQSLERGSTEERLNTLEQTQLEVLRAEQRQQQLLEELQTQKREIMALDLQQRKYTKHCEDLIKCAQDLESVKSRLKRCELSQLAEQKKLKTCQESLAQSRQLYDAVAKRGQDSQAADQQRFLKSCEERYAKWREDAVAWQQQQLQRMQGQ